jgi:tetratricopeptide (TPR) repeat protein
MSHWTLTFAAAALALPLAAFSAHAAGSGDSNTPTCPTGEVYDQTAGKCVKQSGALDTDSLYETGRKLAMDERFGEAIAVLSLAADRGDARILNYLGYSHRKQGRVLVGLGYYQEALKLSPDYTQAREYLGEAYLQLGDLAGAQRQLSEIETRCGSGCPDYVELRRQIDAYLAGERSI